MLTKFRMTDANPISTLMDPSVILHASEVRNKEGKEDLHGKYTYATIIGLLMYVAMVTRPDIAYAVITLAQFTGNPSLTHWTAAKHVLRYLKGTMNLALTYGGEEDWGIDITQYVDADGGTNPH